MTGAPDAGETQTRPGSWTVLGAYIGLVASSHALWISFASVTADAAGVFHTTELSIGLLVSVGPICSAVFSIPAGVLPDRVGYRTPLLVAGAATVVFAFLRPLVGSFPLLLLLTIALLVPQPFLINAVADLVNRHFSEHETATATGMGTMAIFLGITVGVAVTPALVSAVGVRGSQFVYAGMAAVALVVFWVVAPRPVPDRLVEPEELPVGGALRRVVRSRTLWKLSALLFCGFGFYLGMTTWLEEILKPHGIGASAAGLVAGSITIGGVVGSVAIGAASDRIHRRKPFLVAAGIVAIPTLWLLGHLSSPVALVISRVRPRVLPARRAPGVHRRGIRGRLARTAGVEHCGRRDPHGRQSRRCRGRGPHGPDGERAGEFLGRGDAHVRARRDLGRHRARASRAARLHVVTRAGERFHDVSMDCVGDFETPTRYGRGRRARGCAWRFARCPRRPALSDDIAERRSALHDALEAGHEQHANRDYDRGELRNRARDRARARTPGFSIGGHRPLGGEGSRGRRGRTRGRRRRSRRCCSTSPIPTVAPA